MGQRFSAVIGKVGINPCVDVPEYISVALRRTGYVLVRATLNGHPFRAGLVCLGGGRHRLFVDGQMRKAAGIDPAHRRQNPDIGAPSSTRPPSWQRLASTLSRRLKSLATM